MDQASVESHPPPSLDDSGKGSATDHTVVDDDDDDDDTGDPVGIRDDFSAPTYFACPFYKFDPARHFRCFRKYELRRYSDVKQHILRCHTLTSLYCTNCWRCWGSSSVADWETHVWQSACKKEPVPDQLLPREAVALTELATGAMPEESRWYLMWKLLFPGHPCPTSPYMVPGPSDVLSLLDTSMSALQEKLPSLLRSRGVDLGSEAAASLVAEIHGIYINTPLAATTRRRLKYRTSLNLMLL